MRKQQVERGHPQLSIRRQCELLDVNRNRLEPRAEKITEEDLRIMRLIDERHLKEPTYGVRRLRIVLERDHKVTVGRQRLARLMVLVNVHAIHPGPRTSIPGQGHKMFPYLLRKLEVSRANQVWCSDITYIPMPRGFCYLAAVMDWHTRAVLGWAVSTALDTNLCLSAFQMAVKVAGRHPEIMNTDQGCQYTSAEWIGELERRGIQISMDGKGRWVDNVFIERLWRSLKYEEVYLMSHETPREVERAVADWFGRYNHYRPHASLDGKTPWVVYSEKSKEAGDAA